MYSNISEIMNLHGEASLHQGFLINDALNAQFKYQREQARTSFKEAHALVRQ